MVFLVSFSPVFLFALFYSGLFICLFFFFFFLESERIGACWCWGGGNNDLNTRYIKFYFKEKKKKN